MFYQNRFTERAQKALTLAQEAAGSFGHSYIGSEHLLLGLLREGGGPAAKALAAAGVTEDALVKQIEDLSGRGAPDSAAPQGMTPRTKRIIELSLQSAGQDVYKRQQLQRMPSPWISAHPARCPNQR